MKKNKRNITLYHRGVYLRVTNICNKSCDFCFYKNETAPRGFMELNTVKDIMEKEHAMHDFRKGPLHVQLTGGEPTLHPQLLEIVTIILSYPNVCFFIETNGSHLKDPNFLRLFTEFPNRIGLKISMNSELITPTSDWIENILYLKEQSLPLHFSFMARYKNQEDKKFLEAIIEKYNLDWKILHPIDYARDHITGTALRLKSSIIYTVDGTVLVDMT